MKKQFARVFSLMMVLMLVIGVPASADQLTMKEGANINLSVAENGGNSTITISSTDTNTDEKVKVSSGDTADFLESQIVGGTGVNVNSDGSQITISAPPVNVEDSADGVEVTFAHEFDNPPGSGENLSIDINGTNLDQPNLEVTVGGVPYNFLPPTTITGPLPNMHQVIATPPAGTSRFKGHHKLKLKNDSGFSEGLVFLSNLIGGNDADTKLLLHFDGNFDDVANGATNPPHTVNVFNAITVNTPVSPLTQGNNVASFDGTGDYLTIADSSDWDFGTGDFTFDFWIRLESIGNDDWILMVPVEANYRVFGINQFSNGSYFRWGYETGGWQQTANGTGLAAGVWYHIALVRDTGVLKFFLNGVEKGSVAMTDEMNISGDIHIMTNSDVPGNTAFQPHGYIDEFRISKGIARWKTDFSSNLPNEPYN